ncbi:TPA: type VI secretion system tip protein VgrG [Klebsiella pneumoniae]|uniref:ImpA family type VI secretion-associated protein n=3 Tax=Klebsiella pneumoniae TaxID=573 RepID=A0A9Q8C181_KLEPN|nr:MULTISPECIES: type VI secretion system Vgr family protein [Klebsiella]HAJ6215605.1 type VI secretion system tip protein VgrG [Escherichia coli]HDS7989989.1 type VI secretion system tip protein VgrG [Klebsiella pneumoniae subsp. ozaenae]AIG85220.1 type IV secretion protein Rhs [Klebsiella pneumoniae subsp. pneumoniae PittNDM01]ALH87554.1 type IV secretion protein Rhs [Klebsiella pneumoniae]ALP80209.1 type IV secretion protein Rhs [Klebsiella pneumoniae]
MDVQNFDHSHHALKIRGLSSGVDVLSFEGKEQLSAPFRYDIQFTSSDKSIAPESVLMQDGAFSLTAPPVQGIPTQTPLRTLYGVITGFKQLSSSRDEARYEVRLEPRLALLSRSHQNAIYQNQTVPQIVEKILRERHEMRGQDFVFNLKGDYPSREQVMQYDEDDLTFISRLLSVVGIWFRFSTDARLKIGVIEFYDDQSGYERGLTLPLRHPSGMSDSGTEAVWDLNTAYSVVSRSVTTRDYNYREAMAEMTTGQFDVTGGDNTTYGEAYHYADNFLKTGDKATPESGAFYARIRHERYLNGRAILKGQSTSSLLMPGLEIKVEGNDAPEVFRKGILITGITASAARDRSYELAFTAIPYSERYGYRPPLIRRPVMAGTLPARVTSTTANDVYAHIDKDGRYRVNLDFDRDTWKPGFESLWVRQSRPYAGDTYGLHLPLLAGTEVSIAFEDGNPDRPYIAGVKHDSAHTDHVTIQNYKRNVLRTPANNKIRLDDERGKEHIKVSTEYGGKSQLNLGHLVDAGKQQRGEGFELRTDMWGAIRAKKGVFISADEQEKAQGQALMMDEALSQLQEALSLVEALHSAAEVAKSELADLQTQKTLLSETLTELKKSALLLSAPAGIAQVTPKSLQLSSGENLISTSGKNTDFSVFKKFTVAAGEAVSLFAQKLGIKIFASKGKVEIQAQSDEMLLDACKDLRISSSDGKILISAKNEIILTSGGGYIRIGGGTVECAAPDKIIERGAVWQKFSGQSISQAMQEWDSTDFAITPEILWMQTGKPAKNQKVRVTRGDGTTVEMTTDDQGKLPVQSGLFVESIKIDLLDNQED